MKEGQNNNSVNSGIKKTILFSLRLLFYLSVSGLVFLHPGIVVTYDRSALILFFFIIPVQSLIAFLPSPEGKFKNKLILALVVLFGFSFIAAGFSPRVFFSLDNLGIIGLGILAFVLTWLLFYHPRWAFFSVTEPFILGWICFRLLVFSRSGEDAAGESYALTQFIMSWTIIVFLLHSAVIYLCLYPKSTMGIKKEFLLTLTGAIILLSAIIFFVPADFVRNIIIENFLEDRMDRRAGESDNDWGIDENSGGRRQGRRTVPGDNEGRTPSLRSLSEYDWPGDGRSSRGTDQNQQYAVMVVASKYEPVYMGNSIRGLLDPVHGFIVSPNETFNRLSSQRFFVTWNNSETYSDMGRYEQEIAVLSTLSFKYMPYRPLSIDPTIQYELGGPFRFIHSMVSGVHYGDPMDLLYIPGRPLSARERAELSPYLELPLEQGDLNVFQEHLDKIMEDWEENRSRIMGNNVNESMEKIAAILLGFSDFQYHINFNNTAAISDLLNFITNTREGDCVEFSHTAALLGRMAGIPSRVVTGFLASEGLQTTAHLRGLMALRNSIPFLQEFPFDDLYLVTDAHGHAWPQFYVPGYGWLDFEATAFAIPPIGLGDGNLRDVVIPRLDENRVFSGIRAFPWEAVLRTLITIIMLLLIAAYSMKYGRELYIYQGQKKGGQEGARYLYLLLLAKLASEGKPIKPVSKTAPEYAALFPGDDTADAVDGSNVNAGLEAGSDSFAVFARIYTELRWRSFNDKAEAESRFVALKKEYENILAMHKRKGLLGFIKRIFSLRGLAYL